MNITFIFQIFYKYKTIKPNKKKKKKFFLFNAHMSMTLHLISNGLFSSYKKNASRLSTRNML